MYIYHNGLIIREGTSSVPAYAIKALFEDAGWSNDNIPSWQIEKFTIAFENSTWAFTIWDEEEMIAMVRVISDGIMIANIVNLVVKCEYRGKGLGKKLVALCLQNFPTVIGLRIHQRTILIFIEVVDLKLESYREMEHVRIMDTKSRKEMVTDK